MTAKDKPSLPSLLDDTARGGDINEGGISFQAGVVMAHIPRWMAADGFSSMIREAMFDAEAQFYVPGRGLVKEAIEVKDHTVNPTEFWNEIHEFKRIDEGSPGTYEWFTLAIAGLPKTLQPVRNGLRRVRDPYGFYQKDPSILDTSYRQFVKRVIGANGTAEDADFLFHRVLIQDDWSEIRNNTRGVFLQRLNEHLPHHLEMPAYVNEDIYTHLGRFVQERRAQPISRVELEAKMREKVPAKFQPSIQPVTLFTAIDSGQPSPGPLVFAWEDFFGGTQRIYPPAEVWNERMLGELQEAKEWILNHRSTRRIRLDGSRRLSTSVAIGFIFSAVAGFAIETINRGDSWPTDAHADNSTPSYELSIKEPEEQMGGEHLVVSIGLPREIIKDVESDLDRLGLAGVPTLHIHGSQPVVSPQQLNHIVWDIKTQIARALTCTGARQIDLFIAGPAPLALFLGHRLNATAAIQCYEQAGNGQYVPTCLLT